MTVRKDVFIASGGKMTAQTSCRPRRGLSLRRGAAALAIAALAAGCPGGGGQTPPATPTPARVVGGYVSGLAGTGLVLQNSLGDDLPIAASGSFAFATRVAEGAAYSVTVKTQPTGPSQLCSVAGGEGTVGAGDVGSVTVTCVTRSFAVGGTVSGLLGTGLTLRSLTGELLPVSADGSFEFPTEVASGGAYRVTVSYQPIDPPQTCFAASGEGTVGDGPVTDVAVTCTTNSYAVGGTVSGLAGTGLVLQDNGGDDLAVPADGAFTFPTKVLYGAGYSVTVKTQPGTPAQLCAVVHGEGTVGAANVTSVEVRCDGRRWGTPRLLESDAVGSAYLMDVAAADERALAIWHQTSATRHDLKAGEWSSFSGWSSPAAVEADDTSTVSDGDAASRRYLAVWSQGGDVWASRPDLYGVWASPQHLEAGAGLAFSPRVEIDGSTNAIAVWVQDDGATHSIMSSRFTWATGWGAEEPIESGAGLAGQPALAVAPGGDAIAVWIQSDGTRDNLWAARFDVDGGWGAPQLLEQDDRGSVSLPSVVMDPAGNGIVVWSQSDGADYHSWTVRYASGAGWGGPELLDDGLAQSISPRVAVGPDGSAVAVFVQSNVLHARRFTAAGAWSLADEIDTFATGYSSEPVVAIDGSGNAIVLWRHGTATRYDLWANRYTPGSGWDATRLVETEATGTVELVRLAVDPGGTAFAVWSQASGSRYDAWANIYR